MGNLTKAKSRKTEISIRKPETTTRTHDKVAEIPHITINKVNRQGGGILLLLMAISLEAVEETVATLSLEEEIILHQEGAATHSLVAVEEITLGIAEVDHQAETETLSQEADMGHQVEEEIHSLEAVVEAATLTHLYRLELLTQAMNPI